MKLTKFTLALATAAIMAGCSSDEPYNSAEDTIGEGYMSLAIELPTIQGSRAYDTDWTYENGEASEYAVNNGVLLVFKKSGSSELDYTFVETATLKNLNAITNSDSQITVDIKSIAKLGSVSVTNSDEYYGYVILNNPTTGGISVPSAGQKFGDWLGTAQTPAGTNGIYMASAPRYAGNAVPTTLVKLDKTKIASSEAAISDVAATIFVERGVAKVTVTTASFNEMNVSGSTYSGDKVQVKKWALDITNKSTFPGRNVIGVNNPYANIWSNSGKAVRFVGGTATFQRVFWGKDPNYSTDITNPAQYFNVLTIDQLNASDNVGKALYCLENTFDIMHMKQGQTTRVVFKAQYTPKNMDAGTTFFRIGTQSTIWSQANLTNFIKSKAAEVCSVTTDKVAVTLSSAILNSGGSHPLTADQIKVNGANISSENLSKLIALISAADGIVTYYKGESFYVARVRHFNDLETPWSLGQATYGENNAENNEKYLGRYSVVRNCWYELAVKSISNPGSATIPEIDPNLPDDETDLYISVTVNILPWAKRVQNVDL